MFSHIKLKTFNIPEIFWNLQFRQFQRNRITVIAIGVTCYYNTKAGCRARKEGLRGKPRDENHAR